MVASATPLVLSELAAKLGCELISGGDTLVCGVAALADASATDLSFVRSGRYQAAFAGSRAGAVIVGMDVDPVGRPAIRAADPSQVFARAVALLIAPPRPAPGCHPGAHVEPQGAPVPEVSLPTWG